MDIGSAVGREAGITEEQLRALAEFRTSDAFDDTERAVLAYAEAMSKTPVDVDEETFAALRERFSDAQIVELTAEIAWENWRARFNHALDIQAQGFSDGAFCALAERPKGAAS